MQAHEFLLKLHDSAEESKCSNVSMGICAAGSVGVGNGASGGASARGGSALRESGRYVDSWSRKTAEGNEQAIVAHRCTALA